MNIEGQKLETHSLSFESICGYEESSLSCTMPYALFFFSLLKVLCGEDFSFLKEKAALEAHKKLYEPEINDSAAAVVTF